MTWHDMTNITYITSTSFHDRLEHHLLYKLIEY